MKGKLLKSAVSLVLTVALLLASSVITFAEVDHTANRNTFKYIDHSCDAALNEALRAGETDVTDDKFGINMNNFGQKATYMMYTDTDLVGFNDLFRTYLLLENDVTVTLSYTACYTENYIEQREAYKEGLKKAIKVIEGILPENATDFQKILITHDYLVATTAYDQDAVDREYDTQNPESYKDHWYMYDASGCFVEHRSVCKGYSLSFKAIMDYFGIECMIASSGGGNHAWNIVKLDNQWYHVDCSGDEWVSDMPGRVSHSNFLVSTNYITSNYTSSKSDFVVFSEDYNIEFTDENDATDTKYEKSKEPWKNTNSMCHYYNGHLYSLSQNNDLLCDGEFLYFPNESMRWYPQNMPMANYTQPMGKMSGYKNYIYLTTPNHVLKYNLDTDEVTTVFSPDTSNCQIFGLARIEDKLYCTLEEDLPTKNPTLIYIPGEDIELTDDDESGFVTDGENAKYISKTVTAGENLEVLFSGLNEGETLNVTSSDEAVIKSNAENGLINKTNAENETVSLKALKEGEAKVTVTKKKGESVLGKYEITVTVNKAPVTQTVTVHSVDLEGNTVAEDYTVSGTEGTEYEIVPAYIEGYTAPETVYGTFTDTETDELTLTYIKDVDASAVLYEIENMLQPEEYTEESYENYSIALMNAYIAAFESVSTQAEIDRALTELYTAKANLKKKTFTITVNYVDDIGEKVAESEEYTEEINTEFRLLPKSIDGYITPSEITDSFTEDKTVTVTYVLSTDKTALENELSQIVPMGEYTDESYFRYILCVAAAMSITDNERALQKDVDKALENVTSAKEKLETYDGNFEKCEKILSDREYLIVSDGRALVFDKGKLTASDVIDENGIITSTDGAAVWILQKNESGYALKNKASGKYLAISEKGTLIVSDEEMQWTVDVNSISFGGSFVACDNEFYLTDAQGIIDICLYIAK